MQISKDKVISLSYTLTTKEDNGESTIIEEVPSDSPFVFIFGHEGLPPQFEQKLEGMNQGDDFNFALKSDETGYGEYDEESIVDFPRNIFTEGGMTDGDLEPGQIVYMKDEDGQSHRGTIVEAKGETITVDFNHPLAGLDLEFSGKIENVRDASAEEIDHGHVHGEGGHQH